MDFDLQHDDRVKIVISDEEGVVVGRADYRDRPPQYFVNYQDATGCAKGDWFNFPELALIVT